MSKYILVDYKMFGVVCYNYYFGNYVVHHVHHCQKSVVVVMREKDPKDTNCDDGLRNS